jgi:hypothetical protein
MRTKLAWFAAAALIAAFGGGLAGALTSMGDRLETRPAPAGSTMPSITPSTTASPVTPTPTPSPTETDTGFEDEGDEDDDGSSGPGSGDGDDEGGSGPG